MNKQCPFEGCKRVGRPFFDGYCSSSHKKLAKRLVAKSTKVVLFCASCDTPVVRNRSQVSEGGKAFCKRCRKNSGETHPNWKEGQYVNAAGYRCILHKKRYVLEHRHTWEQANKACILPWLHSTVAVHHINMVKLDNRPENLVLLPSEEHGRIHRLMDCGRWDEAQNRLVNYLCGQTFFASHPQHLEFYINTPLEEIINGH